MSLRRRLEIAIDWLATPPDAGHSEKRRYRKPSFNDLPLPEGADEYLRASHPRLAELKQRYADFGGPFTRHSLWTEKTTGDEKLNLQYFRGDNPYVYQYRGLDRDAEKKYLAYAAYVAANDPLGLLDRLAEDGLFGAYTFDFDGTPVSRDLLDSINELGFLERNLGISAMTELTALDVGAGYGRLAHRASEGLGNMEHYYCTDAVAESTFLSEYYLHFRGVGDRATVLGLDEVQSALSDMAIDLAVNVHSFSECRLVAIEGWLDVLEDLRIRSLMIVPNTSDHLLSREPDKTHRDFGPALEARGYRLVAKEPKFLDGDLQRWFSKVPIYYLLFERSD